MLNGLNLTLKIGVIAGTTVDTKMGMEYLGASGLEIRFRYFDEIINSDMKNIRYALSGDISKVVMECDQ